MESCYNTRMEEERRNEGKKAPPNLPGCM